METKTRADILVVGGGAAGLAAAVSAAECGASVIVLEKNAATGGNGTFPMGIFGAGSNLQKRALIDPDKDLLFSYAMEYSHWKSDARLIRILINRSGDTIEWLQEQGVPFNRLIHHKPNQTPEVFHMVEGPKNTGRAVMDALLESCERFNVDVITRARCKKLICNDKGEVIGVSAELMGKGAVDFMGSRVIIATGGFTGNNDIARRFIPDYDIKNYLHLIGVRMDGDGLSMAEEAGAAVENDIALEGGAPMYPGSPEVSNLICKTECIWINKFGERFADEGIIHDFTDGHNAVSRQPGKFCYVLFDSKIPEMAREDPPGVMMDRDIKGNGMEQLDAAIEAAQKRDDFMVSDSLASLASWMGLDEQTLRGTVEEYNEFCRTGYDEHFNKDRRSLLPIDAPPYYAVRGGIDLLTTHGGIRINYRFEVLNSDHMPIPGLYAAGVDASGIDSGGYQLDLSGHAFGFSVGGGRIVGENAAKSLGFQINN